MNFLQIWPWWGWALSTLGIGGIIACVIFAPALANAIAGWVLKKIGAAIRTPLGAGLIAGALAFGAAWFWQGLRLEAMCNAQIQQMKDDARSAANARDAAIRQELERKYQPIVRDLEQQAADREEKVQDYERQILAKNRGKCVLSPDTLRLRP